MVNVGESMPDSLKKCARTLPLYRVLPKTCLLLVITLLLAPLSFLVLVMGFPWRESIGPRIVRWYSRLCLIVLRVRIEEVRNYDAFLRLPRGILIVSNHTSFLDILVLSSLFGATFVSKAEVKYYPIVGQIAPLVGTIFLNRDSGRERVRLIKKIARDCSNRTIVVFPQGTTARSTDRLPFNRGIFKVVELNPAISLLPVTLSYREEEEIAWCKPQSLIENAVRVSARECIHVTVTVHTPLSIDDYQGKTSEEICAFVQQIVSEPVSVCRSSL